MSDLTIRTEFGLDSCTIGFVQKLEDDLDEALLKSGFTRSTTTKSGAYLEFNYRQFAFANQISDEV